MVIFESFENTTFVLPSLWRSLTHSLRSFAALALVLPHRSLHSFAALALALPCSLTSFVRCARFGAPSSLTSFAPLVALAFPCSLTLFVHCARFGAPSLLTSFAPSVALALPRRSLCLLLRSLWRSLAHSLRSFAALAYFVRSLNGCSVGLHCEL